MNEEYIQEQIIPRKDKWRPENIKKIYRKHLIKPSTKIFRNHKKNFQDDFNKIHIDYDILLKKIKLQVIKYQKIDSKIQTKNRIKSIKNNYSETISQKRNESTIIERLNIEKLEDSTKSCEDQTSKYPKRKNSLALQPLSQKF